MLTSDHEQLLDLFMFCIITSVLDFIVLVLYCYCQHYVSALSGHVSRIISWSNKMVSCSGVFRICQGGPWQARRADL